VALVAPPRGIGLLRADARALEDGPKVFLRAPRGQAEAAATPADPSELTRDRLVVRREDGAEARGDDVEGRVLVGQVLGVAFVPPDREPAGVRPRLLEERGRDVDADDLRPGPGGTDRDRPGSRGDIQPPLAGARPEPGDELVVGRRQPLGNEAVVTAGPQIRGGQRRVPRTT
jgi:hypothetical protein